MSKITLAMDRIVVVGCGMTGAVTASLLKQESNKNIRVTVLDKSRGAGGRMSTSRADIAKCSTVDLGAQYISITQDYAVKNKRFHDELISSGLLKPMTGLIEGSREKDGSSDHFVTPNGISSVVKHYLNKSGAEALFNHQVSQIDVDEDNKIHITTQEGTTHDCAAVVLTMPVPQILQLKGTIRQLIDSNTNVKQNLEKVTYSSRFAVGLFYNPGTTIKYPWSAKYFENDPCIRFVTIDNRKRAQDNPDLGPSVAVHTTVPFSLQNLESDKDQMAAVILKNLKHILPDLPEPNQVKGHKWRYSQVHHGYPGSPGCVVLSDQPSIILAGDAFTHSTVDGCIASATAVTAAIANCAGKL